jgi:hypothetical protein
MLNPPVSAGVRGALLPFMFSLCAFTCQLHSIANLRTHAFKTQCYDDLCKKNHASKSPLILLPWVAGTDSAAEFSRFRTHLTSGHGPSRFPPMQ